MPPPPPVASAPAPWPQSEASGSGGLRTASIVLFWCTAAAAVLVVAALFNRRSAWTDLADREGTLVDALQYADADDLVGASLGLVFLLGLAALIVVSIWSLRVGRRARRAGASSVSPGLACGSWYIPYASAIVPFIQLRRMARHRGRSTASLNVWQGCYIAAWVGCTICAGLEPDEDDVFADLSDVTAMLNAQAGLAVATVVASLVMAFVAMGAMSDVDDS
jgi:hypothetical protein